MLGAAINRIEAQLSGPPGLLHPAMTPGPAAVIQSVHCYSHGSHETDEEFDAVWVTYFNKPDTDAWELCKGVNTLVSYDLVPEQLNDFASAVHILEAVKDKGLFKNLLIMLLKCKQSPGNTGNNILPCLNKFSFTVCQTM
uniref:Cytochrome c oxidase subunit 5A, mitochondrial n=1 Tax=Piliocolobus tephrosceles TaxID=591936 RepID=A0A8C9IVY0_9PRIM